MGFSTNTIFLVFEMLDLGGGFQKMFIFIPIWGNDPIWLAHIFHRWVGSTTNPWFVVVFEVFTFDYLLKMGCAPFVRLEVVDPTIEYFDMHSWNNRPMSSWERFSHFSRQSTNVIDLLAVLPWWCDLMLLGESSRRGFRTMDIFLVLRPPEN